MILASIYNPRNSQQPTVVLNSTEQAIIAIRGETRSESLELEILPNFSLRHCPSELCDGKESWK